MAADVGTGTTITFGTSSYAAEITGVTINGEEVPVIDISHMGTTGTRAKMLGDLKENVTLDVQVNFDPDEPPPIGSSETITVTFPIPSGSTNGATRAGTGAIVSHSEEVPLEDKMTGTYRVQ